MFPLLDETKQGATPGYLTLAEALAAGVAEIGEVSDGGRVPELRFLNRGDRPVLLLDGEELVGAKQNRVLNTTVIAAAKSEIVIPVSCVEAGRWSWRSQHFSAAGRVHPGDARASRVDQVSDALRRSQGLRRTSDQADVWARVDAYAERYQARSPTAALGDVYAHEQGRLEETADTLTPQPGQVGAVFARDGRVVGVDLFDCPTTLAHHLAALAASHALDVVGAGEEASKVPTTDDVRAFLARIAAADAADYPAVGLGRERRLSAADLAGVALVADDHVVHLAAFVR